MHFVAIHTRQSPHISHPEARRIIQGQSADTLGEMRNTSDNVHIHTVRLNLPEHRINTLYATLSADEVERADRFLLKRHRVRFISCRGILREILGGYLAVKPSSVTFDYGKYGKPALHSSIHPAEFSFNLSHSGDMAVFAVTRHADVGVDIEHVRTITNIDMIAKRYFTADEYTLVSSCSGEEKLATFFDIWTLKEACLKTTGKGLIGLEQLNNASLPAFRGHFRNFTSARGYSGAIATRDKNSFDQGQPCLQASNGLR